MQTLKPSAALKLIEQHGLVLVFPLRDRPDAPSLWSLAYPRSEMRWDWSGTADPRVVALWHVREELARSGKVPYGKWFRGRATFFSRPVFQALLHEVHGAGDPLLSLVPEARAVLELLEDESPQPLTQLRAAADLRGRELDATWNRALKQLWTRLLTVGVGEDQEGGGAMPSLLVGATALLFEDLWRARHAEDPAATKALQATLAAAPPFARELQRTLRDLRPQHAR